ncbi:MAG: response regulator [Candidatus Ozemobacteraceae bacterium]
MKTRSPLKILIIDDDEVDRMRLQRLLRECVALQPMMVDEAVDMASGLATLESRDFDCVLLDQQLPDGTGLSILQELKSGEKIPPPIIMQTVFNDEETGMRAVEAGAQDFLVKGYFDSNVLTRVIRYACERNKLLRQKEQLILELKTALAKVKTLEGILPICCMCKKIRDDEGYWKLVERYFMEHTSIQFSHGFCPECLKIYMHQEGLESPSPSSSKE